MQLFKINDQYTIYCESQGTRSGFRHIAILAGSYGTEIARSKACYINRTWGAYQFNSVMQILADKLDKMDKKTIADTIRDYVKNRTY